MTSRSALLIVMDAAFGGGTYGLAACGLDVAGTGDAPLGDGALVLDEAASKNDDATNAGADGATDAAVDAATDSAAIDGGPVCPSGRGPTMVLVTLSASERFCIDSTEVTRGQYKAFLGSVPFAPTQPATCAWNTSFLPLPAVVDLSLTELPVVKVDWCDAYAFCAWAGKRLCGAIAGGGALSSSVATDPTKSEWMAACSKNGARAYPYGTTYVAGNCNHSGAPLPAAVGTYKACVGGYAGLFDMNGNVTEWENACDGNQAANGAGKCMDRGGSYAGAEDRCNYASLDGVMGTSSDWGIRCCATP